MYSIFLLKHIGMFLSPPVEQRRLPLTFAEVPLHAFT